MSPLKLIGTIMKKKGQIIKYFAIAVLTLFCGFSLGCSKKQPAMWIITKQTTQQMRHNYIHTLRESGARVIKLGETIRIVFPSDVLFAANSANINPHYRSALIAAANLIKTYQTVSVKVAAYSDNIRHSRIPKNRKVALTDRQAQVVSDYLYSLGIQSNARLVYAKGYGAKHPVAQNKTGKGRSVNRRVEVSFRFYPTFKKYD